MPITILIVDDAEIIRFLYARTLERDPELRVVATAEDGHEAIALAEKHQPDVILLDIEMPRMDGLKALPHLRKVSPESQIFIVSGTSHHYADAAIDALAMGATEFFVKPGVSGGDEALAFHQELRATIKEVMHYRRQVASVQHAMRARELMLTPAVSPVAVEAVAKPRPSLRPRPLLTAARLEEVSLAPAPAEYALRPRTHHPIHALAIASSTGGPETLLHLFSQLKGQLMHLPIFITQHMPPVFTASLAEHIAQYGERKCREAVHGERALPGVVYVAPGGHHLTVRGTAAHAQIHVTNDAPVNSCRPAADPMFASLSHVYGKGLLAVVLTGIGQDGLNGARVIVDQGGAVLAQDKASSVVFGMPRAVAEAGLCEAILPPNALVREILARTHRRAG